MDKLILKKIKFITNTEGQSMFPFIQSNDGIYIRHIIFSKLKINDIVIFRQKGKFITHRIIYKKQNYIVTKGDNNLNSDGKIYPKQIIGKVYQIRRNGKIINLDTLYLLQSSLYFQEINKIKQAFEKEKIEFVFLKGLPLHLYFEKTHPRRIYADCDVLINKKDLQKAEKIVLKFGYKKTEAKNKQVENNYFKVMNGFSVIFDLHLEPAFLMTQFSGLEALYPQKLIDKLTEELLKNKKKVKINNEFFFILNTRYLILYLALHLFHHNFRGAFRYQFLDKIVRIGLDSRFRGNDRDSEWRMIAQKITEYRLENFVYPVFILLKKYYNTPLPRFFVLTMKQWNNETINIFDDEPRIRAGINRFRFIFTLSPQPLWRKLFIFLNPNVVWSIFWIIWKKLSSFLIKYKPILRVNWDN
ncbi:MAG: nucleotidyltransferase family protein [Patescibacteria group bacterium]